MGNHNKIKSELSTFKTSQFLFEGMLYSEDMSERMHDNLVYDLMDNKTSLGDSPCFPVSDERNFATKVVGDRFKDVVNGVKSAYNVDTIG
jgi:hypothetical protein